MKLVISVKDLTPNTINTKLTCKNSNDSLDHLTSFLKIKIKNTIDTFQAICIKQRNIKGRSARTWAEKKKRKKKKWLMLRQAEILTVVTSCCL